MLTYSACFTQLAHKKEQNKIKTYQKRITKCLYEKTKRYSWTKLCEENKLLNYEDLIFLETATFMHNVYNDKIPIAIKNGFTCSNYSANYRLNHHNHIHKSLHNIFCNTWNSLPYKLKSIKYTKNFKNELFPNTHKKWNGPIYPMKLHPASAL